MWAANWKAGVKYTLEPYHTAFIHAKSNAEVAEIDGSMTLHPRFSSEFHRLKDKSRAWWQVMAEAAGLTVKRRPPASSPAQSWR